MMLEKRNMDFCTECRKHTKYTLQKRSIIKNIKDTDYRFEITVAVCDECGKEMDIPGLIDKNIQEVDEQYRACTGIVTINEIEKLMNIYNIGKGPLSLALGFGEITITRYLSGQIPSKEYSDIIRSALASPDFMKRKLNENKDKIAQAAYNKAIRAAEQLGNLFSVSNKMLKVISYIFETLEEVTPLMLQKLLYFIQGVSCALNKRPMFRENCQAWVHGPVYPEVYEIFRDFKYNPIDDARFAIFAGAKFELTDYECKTIDLVLNTFGEYSGKVLERITHSEAPWRQARVGYGDDIPSNELISVESIEKYYVEINEMYDFSSENGLKKYIVETLLNDN